ncbi:MAG: hypothetical protein ACRC5A_10740 [Enterobacteriaceae bacterium]
MPNLVPGIQNVGISSAAAGAASDPDSLQSSNKAQDINSALQRTAQTPEAKCIVVGYSPTGGGHTARTLNILKMALENGKIPQGSTVIFHVPPSWPDDSNLTSGVGAPLYDLCKALSQEKVTVLFAEADKPVYGYLTEEGGSDDVKILQRMASYPLRTVSSTLLTENAVSFVAKAFGRLFNPAVETSQDVLRDIALQTREKKMRDSLFLKRTREYSKLVVQLFQHLDSPATVAHMRLTARGKSILPETAIEVLTDDHKLAGLLALPVTDIQKLPFLHAVRAVLISGDAQQRANLLKEFSESFVTGF